MTKDELELDQNARRALFEAYRLLMALADEKAEGSEDPPQDSAPPTAQDGAQKAPSQQGA